ARVVLGEAALGEAADLHERDGHGVAQGERERGAGGRREVVRAGLLFDGGVDPRVAARGELGGRVAAETHDWDSARLERGEEAHDLLRVARMAEREDRVAGLDDAEVAMEAFGRVQKDREAAGARERG